MPGLGPVCARPLLLDLPELGTLSRQRLAALGGWHLSRVTAAPSGAPAPSGGRAHVRTTPYMRTLGAVRDNPVLKPFDERYGRRGRPRRSR